MSPSVDLSGRAALVTGDSRGIGAATVRSLHDAGASVLFTYLTGADEAALLSAQLKTRIKALRCDIGDHNGLEAVVDACVESFGSIDILVNNAAAYTKNPFDGQDFGVWHAQWQRTFAVNVFGCADLCWLAMRHMRRQGTGRIINVSSRAAHRGELDYPDYGASKAALVNLTKSIARACAREGITAIAVAPGFVETEMASQELDRHRKEFIGEVPLGRIANADEIAAFITFLASPIAAYANGATVDLNGASYVR